MPRLIKHPTEKEGGLTYCGDAECCRLINAWWQAKGVVANARVERQRQRLKIKGKTYWSIASPIIVSDMIGKVKPG